MNAFGGFAHVGGKLTLDFPSQVKAYVKFLAADTGEEVELEIRKRRSRRSLKQNAYWHGVVVALLAQHCGYTPDEMHEALKAKFLGEDDLSRGLRRIGSTAKLNTQQFVELTDCVVLWAAEELGVIIPQPEKDERKQTKAAKQTRAA